MTNINMTNIVKEVGARTLTAKEVQAILPTYAEIKNQVKRMRDGAILPQEENINEFLQAPQRLNNIGIIGKRGAGKTSILKTLQKELKNNADIFLPIIVPENMADKSNIMATILGMFSNEVKEIERKLEQEGAKDKTQIYKGYFRDCRFVKENVLRKKYDEMIKQFCFIQEDYRSILISQYTTQTEYAKKSSELFNADNEFINKFKEFIHELLCISQKLRNNRSEAENNKINDNEKPMIFIMIDDIDLSTSRCSEVVKVLLSYICQPNIVTFISGDLDTFEEALTIDFLRQDQAFNAENAELEILDSQSIKDRKRDLAYEYLKKVIPPAYRHNVKRWSLLERANFTMGEDQPTLRELLENISQEERAFFTFINEKGEEEALLPMYNLFDETSRGLNNVYSVLISMEKNDLGKFKDEDKKRLIETIISSNPFFNGKRDIINKYIIFDSVGKKIMLKYEQLDAYINQLKKIEIEEIEEKEEIQELNNFTEKSKKEAFQLIILAQLVEYLYNIIEEETDAKKNIQYLGIKFIQSCSAIYEETVQNEHIIFEEKEKRRELYRTNKIWTATDVFREFLYSRDFLLGIHIYNKLKILV